MCTYEADVNAWAHEQACVLRARRYDLLDVEHIADALDDVGKREQRELAHAMVELLVQLLKWQYQPQQRGASGEKAIKAQRKEISYALNDSPSLACKFQERRWMEMLWARVVAQAVSDTGLDCFPEQNPWLVNSEVLHASWLPA